MVIAGFFRLWVRSFPVSIGERLVSEENKGEAHIWGIAT